jgi:uncharacterized protein
LRARFYGRAGLQWTHGSEGNENITGMEDRVNRINVWVLSDGKAGHLSQSKGILAALRDWVKVEEDWVEFKLRVGFLRRVMDVVLRGGVQHPTGWLRIFYRMDELPPGKPDLILSAGGNTRHANAWLAGTLACRNLFCGDLRGLAKDLFAGVITWDESKAGEDGWIVNPTPVAITPEEVEREARQWRMETGRMDERIWTMLLGGDGAGYSWGPKDWKRLGGLMKRYYRETGVRWVVVSSRRTGRKAEPLIREEAGEDVVCAWCPAEGDREISYQAALGCSKRVFVTEDSHMMITEAIASGRQVHTLQPSRWKADPSNLHFLHLYEKNGWISRHALDFCDLFPTLKVMLDGSVSALGRQLQKWWRNLERESEE